MNRRERRRRAREWKKFEEKVRQEAAQPKAKHEEKSAPSQSWGRRFLRKTISRTKLFLSVILGVLGLAGGYAIFHPHVSVEPSLELNPGNPFSTQFRVTNENAIVSVGDVDSSCWIETLATSNNIGVWDPAGALAKRISHHIQRLSSEQSSTIDCPSVMGGLGTYTGNVTNSNIQISVSYRQDWWPVRTTEYYPFSVVLDSKGVAHWIHITPTEQKNPFIK